MEATDLSLGEALKKASEPAVHGPQVRVTFPEQMQRTGGEEARGGNQGWPLLLGHQKEVGAYRGEPGDLPAESNPLCLHVGGYREARDEDFDLTLLLAFMGALVNLGRCDAEVETRFSTV